MIAPMNSQISSGVVCVAFGQLRCFFLAAATQGREERGEAAHRMVVKHHIQLLFLPEKHYFPQPVMRAATAGSVTAANCPRLVTTTASSILAAAPAPPHTPWRGRVHERGVGVSRT